MRNLVETAQRIAHEAHKGQFRRDGKTPYVYHVALVAHKLGDQSRAVIAAAWLHDVLEDSDYTAESLRAEGIPQTVVDAVVAITKMDGIGETYGDYLKRVKANKIASKVKVADMLHNLSDAPSRRQILKYAEGLIFLLA